MFKKIVLINKWVNENNESITDIIIERFAFKRYRTNYTYLIKVAKSEAEVLENKHLKKFEYKLYKCVRIRTDAVVFELVNNPEKVLNV
jgi:hypothetical protein